MRKNIQLTFIAIFAIVSAQAQSNPAILNWLQNTTATGSYYTNGNSTSIPNNILVNCQEISYSANWAYVKTKGVPAYATGPFLDGNPSQATDQNAIFKVSLNPIVKTGTPSPTSGGNIGLFINGVALFDYRDGVAWNNNTGALCGGPGNPPCPGGMGSSQDWNRDAIPAEKAGFDCSKGHPAMGNYHHHQNPSAFKLDLNVISTICNLYDADGLYSINTASHSPLIGFAYDGFPIYGAYAYKNLDATGGIVRMKSSYQLKTQTTRTNGPSVGQVVGTQTFFNGYFREDYEYVAHPNDPDYLDEHNGRICKTPEYPNGIYCYFATVDANHNSAYPYVVGPTFYGVVNTTKVTSITEPVIVYSPSSTSTIKKNNIDVTVFSNPTSDLIAIQLDGLNRNNYNVQLLDINGKVVKTTTILQGSTVAYFDTKAIYGGVYLVKISDGINTISKKVVLTK
jgi:hypothetical protein